ncbi:unnamed protein product [Caenorhabditis nigoni]
MEEYEWNQTTSSESRNFRNFQKSEISKNVGKPVEENRRLIFFKCFQCGKISKIDKFRPIKHAEELLVIVIEWVLNGLSLPAVYSILQEKLPQLMCHEHFESTISKIFEKMEVSKSSDLVKLTTVVGRRIIQIAKFLCPQLSIFQLKHLFFNFCTEHEGGKDSKSSKNRPAVSVQGTGPNKILVLRIVENNNEQSGASTSSEAQYSNKNERWVPNGSRPAESVSGSRKILIRRAAERRAEQLEKQQKLSQYEVWPANTSNVIAQCLEDGTSSESTQNRRQIVIRRVVKRKTEQSEDSEGSRMLVGSSYATSSASESQTFQNYPKQVRTYVRRNAEQSSTSSDTSFGIPSSSFSTSSDPVWTSSEIQNSEYSPGTSTETQNEQLSIPEILSQWNVKIEPEEEEQKPEKIRPPEEYPSFKILEEIRKSGESDSSELRFNYTEADLKADDFVIKIEPEEELKSEPIWDEQWDSEVKEEFNDEQSTEIEPNFSPESTKCPICNQPKSISDLVPLVGKYEKLVVLIPWVIDGFPIEHAISLLNSEKFDFVCLEHPISTVTKIFEYLNVSSIEGLQKIQIGPNYNLTIIAQKISRLFSIGLKKTIFKFCEKFESQESYNQFVMEELERRENEEFRDQMKCVVCRKEEAKDLRKLGDSEEKLIFLSAFLDRITVETARSIYKSNGEFRACHSHFADILKRIFEILPVLRIDDIKKCSIQENHPWMGYVRELRPDITSNQYLKLLHGFCARNVWTSRNEIDENRGGNEGQQIQTTSANCEMPNLVKCVICQKVKSRYLLPKMNQFIERLIVLTGWILTDKTTKIRAISLIDEPNAFVCWSHFSEFSGRIFDELCIKNRNELSTCYQFLVEKLMKTVNSLAPYMKQDEFLNGLESWLTASNWCKPQTDVQSKALWENEQRQLTCSFCYVKKNKEHIDSGSTFRFGCRRFICPIQKRIHRLFRTFPISNRSNFPIFIDSTNLSSFYVSTGSHAEFDGRRSQFEWRS